MYECHSCNIIFGNARIQMYLYAFLFADIDTLTHRGQHTRWFNAGLGLLTVRCRWFACFRQLQSPLLNLDASHDDDDDAHYSDV